MKDSEREKEQAELAENLLHPVTSPPTKADRLAAAKALWDAAYRNYQIALELLEAAEIAEHQAATAFQRIEAEP